jgi:4-diphosphocytidyl-2-C-methyl-D-erythritol kinase
MGRDRARRRGDRVITARAFAKLTLSLRILGRRHDGFHELDALTVSVSEPHDEVTITLARSGVGLVLSGPAVGGVAHGPDNLALRAAHALLEHTARDDGVRIALHKNIPAGAGLGGGSADAAVVLVALDRVLELGLPTEVLAEIGATLGSDVPFCVRGGAAHMRGRGELLEAATVPALHVLVAVPPFAIATPAVYRAWDDLDGPLSTRVVEGPVGLGPLLNDLEPAAEQVQPRLAGFRRRLERAAEGDALLAGSGSAFAVLYEDAAAAAAARDRVHAAKIASTCVVGVTRPQGFELVETVAMEP